MEEDITQCTRCLWKGTDHDKKSLENPITGNLVKTCPVCRNNEFNLHPITAKLNDKPFKE